MSSPRELYSFVDSAGTVYSVTSADTVQTYLGVTYEPITIGRDAINMDSELDKANINVTFDLDNVFANGWLASNTDNVLSLTIFSIDIDNGEVTVAWKGRLSSIKPDLSSITINFESIFTSLRNAGLRAKYQLTCRHALFDARCGVNMNDFVVAGTVSAVSGNTLTIAQAATLPDGRFNGGIVKTPDGIMRYIIQHVGDQITLLRQNLPLAQLFAYGTESASVLLYEGCDRSVTVCSGIFGNILNHGGFPYIPTQNPFGGISIVQ